MRQPWDAAISRRINYRLVARRNLSLSLEELQKPFTRGLRSAKDVQTLEVLHSVTAWVSLLQHCRWGTPLRSRLVFKCCRGSKVLSVLPGSIALRWCCPVPGGATLIPTRTQNGLDKLRATDFAVALNLNRAIRTVMAASELQSSNTSIRPRQPSNSSSPIHEPLNLFLLGDFVASGVDVSGQPLATAFASGLFTLENCREVKLCLVNSSVPRLPAAAKVLAYGEFLFFPLASVGSCRDRAWSCRSVETSDFLTSLAIHTLRRTPEVDSNRKATR
jgi:hypothetical protein